MLDWTAREALAPAGVVASGRAARQLIARIRERSEADLAVLSAVATRDLLVILGPESALPWADGVQYCAPDTAEHMLWLPTGWTPALPCDLVLASLAGRGARVPLLLWRDPQQALPLAQPLALTPAGLDWLERELD